ncbi:hypothetical protein CEXT_498381 [Caerostris extrusa]|uniref:Uncharacterized protein n=1 Tax=Caerostris extrusa TaxID=172846 RepID=A0AAV4THF2_CAEEX|nr:hypothetical protein CEXT_498381 [Caerostris extrusa]
MKKEMNPTYVLEDKDLCNGEWVCVCDPQNYIDGSLTTGKGQACGELSDEKRYPGSPGKGVEHRVNHLIL